MSSLQYFRYSAIILVLGLIVAIEAQDGGKVKLGVYMESLCPDSKRFFLKQLVPTYRLIGNIIEPTIIPFGHARVLGNNKMVCQHGKKECEGNRRMACIQSRSTSCKEQIETIACLFEAKDSVEDCIKKNMPGSNYEDIETCTSSDESYKMMVEAEKETGRVGYVPHLTVDGKYDHQIQEGAEFDLKNFICNHYNGTKPEECQHPAQ